MARVAQCDAPLRVVNDLSSLEGPHILSKLSHEAVGFMMDEGTIPPSSPFLTCQEDPYGTRYGWFMGFYSTEMISMAVTTVVNGAKKLCGHIPPKSERNPGKRSSSAIFGALEIQIIQIHAILIPLENTWVAGSPRMATP